MKRILSDLSYVSHRRLMSDSDTGAVPYSAVCAFVEGEINCNKCCGKRVCGPPDRLAITGIWDNTCEQNRDLMHNHSHNRQLWKKKKKFLLALLPPFLFFFFFFPSFHPGRAIPVDIVNRLGSEIAAGFCLSLFRRGIEREPFCNGILILLVRGDGDLFDFFCYFWRPATQSFFLFSCLMLLSDPQPLLVSLEFLLVLCLGCEVPLLSIYHCLTVSLSLSSTLGNSLSNFPIPLLNSNR